jgi:hypothetical protein
MVQGGEYDDERGEVYSDLRKSSESHQVFGMMF